MDIEASRQAVVDLRIDVGVLASLRQTARFVATHYSTQIEGNRLTQAQVREAIEGARFPGRERDEMEVRNYFRALEEVERLGATSGKITEKDVRLIHALVMSGKAKPTPYRDGQNVIRDAGSNAIVYMPPEAKDVQALMSELVAWIEEQRAANELPAPIIASLAHYQFATIHPYYDGNGRTARLLTSLVLHKSGYGLKGIYSLDEYYARDLAGYYSVLSVGPSHNYYEGRAVSDVTSFVEYFCRGMAEAFAKVRAQAGSAQRRGARDESEMLRQLDPRQRRVIELFRDRGAATTLEIAETLRLSPRTVRDLCREWVQVGFLEVCDASRKGRTYRLSPVWASLVE